VAAEAEEVVVHALRRHVGDEPFVAFVYHAEPIHRLDATDEGAEIIWLLEDRQTYARQCGVELADIALELGDEGRSAVVVVVRPADEAILEGVAEAIGAVAGVVRVHVLAARAEVVRQVLPAADVGDPHRGFRRAAGRGCALERHAEHVHEREDGAHELAALQFALARALRGVPDRTRARARALATTARDTFAADAKHAAELAKVETWLAQR